MARLERWGSLLRRFGPTALSLDRLCCGTRCILRCECSFKQSSRPLRGPPHLGKCRSRTSAIRDEPTAPATTKVCRQQATALAECHCRAARPDPALGADRTPIGVSGSDQLSGSHDTHLIFASLPRIHFLSTSRTMGTMNQIALCLSGGGFRATFFHLGVVKLLRDMGILKNVTDIYSVSGGSILAAHLALHWDKYARSPSESEFYEASSWLVKFGQTDIRNRLVRRSLLGWLIPRLRRTRKLESFYDDLFEHSELSSLPSEPRFFFLTTSMTTGQLRAFNRDGYHDGTRQHSCSDLSLALAVTCSSAFTPFFPSVKLTRDQLHARAEHFPIQTDHLTDAGVFDNSGVSGPRTFQHFDPPQRECQQTFVSDASAQFDWDLGKFSFLLGRGYRAMDIAMRRIDELQRQQTIANNESVVTFRIGEIVRANNLSLESGRYQPQSEVIQQLTSQIRTDLDEFSLIEICSLVRHGYEVALSQLHTAGTQIKDMPIFDPCIRAYPATFWPPIQMTQERISEHILHARSETSSQLSSTRQKAEERSIRDSLIDSKRLRVRLWDRHDWASCIPFFYILFPLAVLLWFSEWISMSPGLRVVHPIANRQRALSDTVPPSAPDNLRAKALSLTSLQLSWDASADNIGVIGYRVFMNGSQIAVTSGTSYFASGLFLATSHSFSVAAYDSAGNSSAQTNPLNVITLPKLVKNLSGSIIELSPSNADTSCSEEFETTANALKAGDTLVLHGGIYSQSCSRILSNLQGTAQQPIVIRAATGETPVLTRPFRPNADYPENNLELANSSYVIIQGITFKGGLIGVRLRGTNHHIVIENSQITQTGGVGFTVNDGITDSLVLRHNEIHHTGLHRLGPDEEGGILLGCTDSNCHVTNSVIEQSYIHDLQSTSNAGNAGIQIRFGSGGNIIRHNVVHTTTLGTAFPCIVVEGSGRASNTVDANVVWQCGDAVVALGDAVVRNNIVLESNVGLSSYPHKGISAIQNVIFSNNTIYGHAECASLRWAGATNMVLTNNALYCGGKVALYAPGFTESGAEAKANYIEGSLVGASLDGTGFLAGGTATQTFANPAAYDFWPKAGSVLRNSADTTHLPPFDFNGLPRTPSRDVGAYSTRGLQQNVGWKIRGGFKVLVSDSTAPSAPTGLRVR